MHAMRPPLGTAPSVQEHWISAEVSPRWVRVKLAGETIADSRRTVLFRESRILPIYYFPRADVRTDLLAPSALRTEDELKGEAVFSHVVVGDRRAEDAAWSYGGPLAEFPDVADHVAFVWSKMDNWYEEDEEVFVHPRDPYKRVDVMPSSRHIQILMDGVAVADSRNPRILFETGHPVRYYLPKADVRMDLLEPSDRHTRCPYKGLASYWSVKLGDNVYSDYIWTYPDPIPECPKIKDLLCFFNERVDVVVDGEPQPRPRTRWSVD